MPNSTLQVLPDARAKSVSKQHLLGDPFSVSMHDYDPAKIDLSEEHRNEMRRKLYVPKIPHVIKKVGTEALDSKYSYADQELPKWQSTMKEEYPPKPCVFDRDSARDLATSMKGCHFVLESPGATNVMQSSTKRDFIRHQYSTVPERYHKTVTEKRYSLTDFEGGDLLPRKVKEKIVHLDERFSVVPSTARYMANVSLGNDTNDWKSVSCSDMVSHPSQPNRQQTEYETLEKKKSSVLDNPDLVLDPIMTVNQAEYTLSDQLDRSTLIYDNSLSKKALKGTHFSLGNDQKMATQSEYLCSFVPLSDHRPRSMIGAQSSDKSCIIAEDYEDRAIGVSSQKLDYKPITSYEPMNTHLEIKHMNSKSSVSFGLDQPMHSVSLSKQDYGSPLAKDPTKSAYKFVKNEGYRGCNYSLTAMEQNEPTVMQSVHSSDFTTKKLDSGAARICHQAPVSHLRLSEQDHKFQASSFTHQVFTDPSEKKHLVPQRRAGMAAEGGLVSRANDMFHITVNNTVTRYPFCQDTFTTTVSETYKGRPTARVPPIKPKGTHVNDNIHPSSKMVETINGTEFKHIRELSTVTRRTYVAPEVMKESE